MHGREQGAREDPARVWVELRQQPQQWPLDLREQRMLLLDESLWQRTRLADAVLHAVKAV